MSVDVAKEHGLHWHTAATVPTVDEFVESTIGWILAQRSR
jgi:hypothetical protein